MTIVKRCYEICGYWPPVIVDGKPQHNGRHIGAYVIAASAQRACALLELRYPGIRVDSVQHKGHRELIEESPS